MIALEAIRAQQHAIRLKIHQAWEMASMFFSNKDAHGIQDAGVEIQALERSLKEFIELEQTILKGDTNGSIQNTDQQARN